MKDELTRDEQNLFQLMADGVIVFLGATHDGKRFACTTQISSGSTTHHQSNISALDAYLKAVAYITAAALEGKPIYTEKVRKKRARLGL